MNIEAIKTFVGMIVRHALTAFGGSLATYGAMTQGDIEAVTGAITFLAGLILSFFDKKKNQN